MECRNPAANIGPSQASVVNQDPNEDTDRVGCCQCQQVSLVAIMQAVHRLRLRGINAMQLKACFELIMKGVVDELRRDGSDGTLALKYKASKILHEADIQQLLIQTFTEVMSTKKMYTVVNTFVADMYACLEEGVKERISPYAIKQIAIANSDNSSTASASRSSNPSDVE